MNKQKQQQKQEQTQEREQPTKESVRNWLRTEIAQRRPPPDPAQIRRELGWDLIEKKR